MLMSEQEKVAHMEQCRERWQQALRVMDGLDDRQRTKGWYMGDWGHIKECETTCCLAGWCGLDPWFQQEGLVFQPPGDYDKEHPPLFPQQDPDQFFRWGYQLFYGNNRTTWEEMRGKVAQQIVTMTEMIMIQQTRLSP